MTTKKQIPNKVPKGTIELNICERDSFGNPTGKRRGFSSDNSVEIRQWLDEKSCDVKQKRRAS